jgi:hypothetical protein
MEEKINMENSNSHRLSPYERAQAWMSAHKFIDRHVDLTVGDFVEGKVVRRRDQKISSMNGGMFTLVNLLIQADRARMFGADMDAGEYFTASVFPSSEVGSLNPLEGDLLAIIFEGKRSYKKRDGQEQMADVFSAELDRDPANEALIKAAASGQKAGVPAEEPSDDDIPF